MSGATPRSATFARSFQQRIPGEGLLPAPISARTQEDREPIRRLFGPNVAKELLGITRGDQTIPDLFMQSARTDVAPAIMKAVEAVLGR
jgi:hypothetical protein